MNLLLIQPSDVLFFRDGRPMSGGLAGHGAAWPLPNVLNAAFHSALHRDLPEGQRGHPHKFIAPDGSAKDRNRQFGALLSAGPFPVHVDKQNPQPPGVWFFPRPADVQVCPVSRKLETILCPASPADQWQASTLPELLRYAVASTRPPAKETDRTRWLDALAFEAYLGNANIALDPDQTLGDEAIFGAEFSVGIGMDPGTQTQDGERIYSAHYLRLRENWRLGGLAACSENPHSTKAGDLIDLWCSRHQHMVIGGQQRLCVVDARKTQSLRLPLPLGLTQFTPGDDGKCRVKWVLLSPAVWPETMDQDQHGNQRFTRNGDPVSAHRGGWLPNWISEKGQTLAGEAVEAGGLLLRSGMGVEKARRKGGNPGPLIPARLVAALVPKPLVVTGWSLGEQAGAESDAGAEDALKPGAKATHLAVPAGAVYYFETEGPQAAKHATDLAATLNWHGTAFGTEIQNRRSTLAGEKGFGLGVCGSWQPFEGTPELGLRNQIPTDEL